MKSRFSWEYTDDLTVIFDLESRGRNGDLAIVGGVVTTLWFRMPAVLGGGFMFRFLDLASPEDRRRSDAIFQALMVDPVARDQATLKCQEEVELVALSARES